MGKISPKHVEFILDIKLLLLLLFHLIGFSYIILPTLMMHGKTQIKFVYTYWLYNGDVSLVGPVQYVITGSVEEYTVSLS